MTPAPAVPQAPAATSAPPTATRRLVVAALLVLAVAACLPAIDAPFTHDEQAGIAANRAIRPGAPAGPVLAYRFSPDQARPLFFLSLWADAQVAARIAPRPFRITSLLLHLACGLVLYGLLRRAASPAPAGAGEGGALAGLALFLLHPLQSESVIYVWGRSGVLSTLFSLLALWLALAAATGATPGAAGAARRRALGLRTGAFACAACALAAKEEAMVLPLLFLIWWCAVEGRPAARAVRPTLGLALAPLLFLVVRAAALGGVGRQVFVRSVADNLLGQGPVTLRMALLVLLPAGQSIDPAAPAPALLPGLAAIAACLAIAGAAACVVVLATRPGGRMVRLHLARRAAGGVLLAAAGCLIYWVVPLPDLMSERRLYLPLAGVAVTAAAIVEWIGASLRLRRGVAVALPAAALACLLAPALHARARVWSDSERLWREAADLAPRNARPWINLGVLAAERGDMTSAGAHFDRAIGIDPANAEGLYNRGKLRLDSGDLPGARADLEAALRASPGMVRARVNLAVARIRDGDLPGAEADLRDALRLDPAEPRALTNLAEVLRATGRADEALPLYREALAADPFYAHAAVRLGVALEAAGDAAGAAAAYREYLKRGAATPEDAGRVGDRIRALEARELR